MKEGTRSLVALGNVRRGPSLLGDLTVESVAKQENKKIPLVTLEGYGEWRVEEKRPTLDSLTEG